MRCGRRTGGFRRELQSTPGPAVAPPPGGVLTEYACWSWCLYVNLIIAAVAVVGALTRLKDDPVTSRARLDVPGVIAAVTGLVGLVYGLGKAETDGWTAPQTLVPIILGALVLAGFVVIESSRPFPCFGDGRDERWTRSRPSNRTLHHNS